MSEPHPMVKKWRDHGCPYVAARGCDFVQCLGEHGHQDEHRFPAKRCAQADVMHALLWRVRVAWQLMQDGAALPSNSTATFLRGEMLMRAAVGEIECLDIIDPAPDLTASGDEP